MSGKGPVTFSELFANTVETHGLAWAAAHYCKAGLSYWEFSVWLKGYRASKR